VVSAGWWVATVALLPASSRPLVDGSSNNSIINLILGYNGLGRLFSGSGAGGGGGSNFSGATGVFRLFNSEMGGQASWLIPAALVTFVAGLVWRRHAPRTDPIRAGVLLWGGWLIVTGVVFSFGQGVIHTYYTVALAPAIAALVGIGVTLLWRQREHLIVRIIGGISLIGSAVWADLLLDRSSGYYPWLGTVILVGAIIGAIGLMVGPLVGRLNTGLSTRFMAMALAVGIVACLAAPLAFTGTTVASAHTGSIPSAGPAVTTGATGGGIGGIPGGVSGFRGGGGLSSESARSGKPPMPSATTRSFGTPPTGSAGSARSGGSTPGAGGAAGGAGGAGGGGMGGQTTSAALTAALKSDASSYRWAAATFGSQSAAPLELASGEAVMAIGGFNGQGGNISLATFESYVLHGDIHYFIASGGGGGGGMGGGGLGSQNSDSAITKWVEAHYTAKAIGGVTVYDLSASAK
jgi:hypothetical protein